MQRRGVGARPGEARAVEEGMVHGRGSDSDAATWVKDGGHGRTATCSYHWGHGRPHRIRPQQGHGRQPAAARGVLQARALGAPDDRGAQRRRQDDAAADARGGDVGRRRHPLLPEGLQGLAARPAPAARPLADAARLRAQSGCAELVALEADLTRLAQKMADGDVAAFDQYSRAEARLEHAGGWAWRDRATAMVRGLGFDDEADLDRRSRRSPAASSRARRSPARSPATPTCCCSTSRRTTSTSSRSSGSSARSCRSTRRSCSSRTTAGSSRPSAPRCSSSRPAARASSPARGRSGAPSRPRARSRSAGRSTSSRPRSRASSASSSASARRRRRPSRRSRASSAWTRSSASSAIRATARG